LEHKELKINRVNNINPESIDFYLSSSYIPAPWTIYKNVNKLESRYNLIVKVDIN
jgi:asparagine synthase (glutamine-hydrolysing)